MNRFFIRLSYKGTRYCGWQRQPMQPSVQQALEEAFSAICGIPIDITGCGRTDTGVHAQNYYAHLDLPADTDTHLLRYRVNAYLEEDVAVHDILPVAADAHARFDAVARTYKYFLHTAKNPFLTDRSFYLRQNLQPDEALLQQFAALLIGNRDFSAFEKKGSDNKHSFCDITQAYWEKSAEGWVFTITANRFLRNMVRAIVGTGLMAGTGKMSLSDIETYIEQKIQIPLTISAPAHGLFLWDIQYPFLNYGAGQ